MIVAVPGSLADQVRHHRVPWSVGPHANSRNHLNAPEHRAAHASLGDHDR